MHTVDCMKEYKYREVEARKKAVIASLQPTIQEYWARRVHPIYTYERMEDKTYSAFISLPGSTNPPVFLCYLSRGWSRLGGQGWQFTHPINGVQSYKNRHDAAHACFRKLARRTP